MLKKKVKSIRLICPYRIKASRSGKKTYALNMNQAKTWHYQTYNNVKKQFTFALADQLRGLEIATPVTISYQVFKPTARKLDKMNVVSIVSKFALDAVSTYGVWEDDSDEFIKTEIIHPTRLDRDDPRVEVFIKTIA